MFYKHDFFLIMVIGTLFPPRADEVRIFGKAGKPKLTMLADIGLSLRSVVNSSR